MRGLQHLRFRRPSTRQPHPYRRRTSSSHRRRTVGERLHPERDGCLAAHDRALARWRTRCHAARRSETRSAPATALNLANNWRAAFSRVGTYCRAGGNKSRHSSGPHRSERPSTPLKFGSASNSNKHVSWFPKPNGFGRQEVKIEKLSVRLGAAFDGKRSGPASSERLRQRL
jgi:hypothetical protein